MAQANTGLTLNGIEYGSVKRCQRCKGPLQLQDGTDPNKTNEIGGFVEEYKCDNCGTVGTYTYRYKDASESFTGACADYDY